MLRLTARLFTTAKPTPSLIEVFVNGKPLKIEPGITVIQACAAAGIEVPRFCYHDRLSIAGNCRMCLVEIEKTPKPVASCAMPVMPGMKIKTDTPMVKKAREGVMEFLLANHPLDCPICDQGGECDLQDQSMGFGSDRSRFDEIIGKRAVEDKDFGPLVKTVMNRCIHCTRCVRFANEVAGVDDLGTSGRGNDMQIGTYVEQMINSEVSGNIIDLCPVGALTSKPYAFMARPWELRKVESVDVLDALGSNIRVDSRGVEVMRILPRLNDAINEEWLSDKARFACDGLKYQRLTSPMIKSGSSFLPISWEEALSFIAAKLSNSNPETSGAVCGPFADVETLVCLKDLLARFNCTNLFIENRSTIHKNYNELRTSYLLNTPIEAIEEADVILLIGTNPRHEAPLLNTRIRKSYIYNGQEIGVIGPKLSLNYEYSHLGEDIRSISEFLNLDHPFVEKFKKAKKPLLLIGSGVLENEFAGFAISEVTKLKNINKGVLNEDWNGLSFLQRNASAVGALDVGYKFIRPDQGAFSFLFLYGSDDFSEDIINDATFVVYQGHHGDRGASFADIILPGSAYTEKTATFVNTEGRSQQTMAAVPPPGFAKEDWKIIRALSEIAGKTLPYDNLLELRSRLSEIAPHLIQYGHLQRLTTANLSFTYLSNQTYFESGNSTFLKVIKDYYITDCISRSSPTMAKCSMAFTKPE